MENIAVGNGQRTRVLECIRKVREEGGAGCGSGVDAKKPRQIHCTLR